MDMETGQANANQAGGEREVRQRHSGDWHCSAVWHKFRVCGPAEWLDIRPDIIEQSIRNIDPRRVCREKIEPIRFVASVDKNTEAEVKLGYVEKKGKIAAVVTWSQDGKINRE
jgi:hypothetical protein